MHDTANFTAVAGPSIMDLLSNPALEARRQEVPAGTVLCEPTEASDKVYFVQQGQVRVYQVGPEGSGRLLEILGPGDYFGTPALAGMTTNGRRLVAVVSTVVWTVQADRLLWFLPTQPAASVEFIRHLAGKLQTACDDAADLVFDDCNRRLLKTLVRFSSSAAAETQDDSVVLRITHEQLAQAVGVARETVSLALTQLRQQNLLRTGRNQLVFNPNVLKTFITKTPAASGAAAPVANEG
jgi:CRP/FNR family transcriptional regulator